MVWVFCACFPLGKVELDGCNGFFFFPLLALDITCPNTFNLLGEVHKYLQICRRFGLSIKGDLIQTVAYEKAQSISDAHTSKRSLNYLGGATICYFVFCLES